jgi:hypothetical protein
MRREDRQVQYSAVDLENLQTDSVHKGHSSSICWLSIQPKSYRQTFDGLFLLNHGTLFDRQDRSLSRNFGIFDGLSSYYRADIDTKFDEESCDSLFTSC